MLVVVRLVGAAAQGGAVQVTEVGILGVNANCGDWTGCAGAGDATHAFKLEGGIRGDCNTGVDALRSTLGAADLCAIKTDPDAALGIFRLVGADTA
jgi:hypothetical protein